MKFQDINSLEREYVIEKSKKSKKQNQFLGASSGIKYGGKYRVFPIIKKIILWSKWTWHDTSDGVMKE